MGIDHMVKDDKDKAGYRLKFMRTLGSDFFQIGVVKYNRGGSFPKWISVFKIPPDTAANNERI